MNHTELNAALDEVAQRMERLGHTTRQRTILNTREHAQMELSRDDARERFMRLLQDLPVDFTESEARFIEVFEAAELSSFWTAATRRTADCLMAKYERRTR